MGALTTLSTSAKKCLLKQLLPASLLATLPSILWVCERQNSGFEDSANKTNCSSGRDLTAISGNRQSLLRCLNSTPLTSERDTPTESGEDAVQQVPESKAVSDRMAGCNIWLEAAGFMNRLPPKFCDLAKIKQYLELSKCGVPVEETVNLGGSIFALDSCLKFLHDMPGYNRATCEASTERMWIGAAILIQNFIFMERSRLRICEAIELHKTRSLLRQPYSDEDFEDLFTGVTYALSDLYGAVDGLLRLWGVWNYRTLIDHGSVFVYYLMEVAALSRIPLKCYFPGVSGPQILEALVKKTISQFVEILISLEDAFGARLFRVLEDQFEAFSHADTNYVLKLSSVDEILSLDSQDSARDASAMTTCVTEDLINGLGLTLALIRSGGTDIDSDITQLLNEVRGGRDATSIRSNANKPLELEFLGDFEI